MTDFATTYEQFLGMIEDQSVRAEVQEHIAKMASSEAQTPEYAMAHRDFVRVLKSRAAHVLPTAWREDPSLEDVTKTYHHMDLRKDWKDVMEEGGVFSFGHLPTFEDIDKHYGEGDHRKHSRTHNVKPTQRVHGNELGTRHKVVRLAALPKYRNNIEGLAADMGLPEDTPYRELVRTENEAAATRVWDKEFTGAEVEEAAEGTGQAGENFKLSAGRARGRRADEHQDPSVQTRDTAARVDRARETATEESGEDQSAASIGDMLAKGGDALDDTTREILTIAKGMEQYVRGTSVFNAWERKLKPQQSKIKAAEARFEASQKTDQDVMELAGVVADAHHQVGIITAALEARLQAGSELREALTPEQLDLIDTQAKRSVAFGSLARPMEYAVQHEYNMRDAGDHERPYGPDEGEGEWSFEVVPLSELRSAYSDLLEELPAGAEDMPNRRQFQPTKPERAEVPAKPAAKPQRLPVPGAEEKPAAKPEPAKAPAAKPQRLAQPAAEEPGKVTTQSAKADLKRELEERGLKLQRGYTDEFAVPEMVEGNMSAKEFFDQFGEEELAQFTESKGKEQRVPAARLPEAPEGREETKVEPAEPATPRASSAAARAAASREARAARPGNRVQPNLPGFGAKPARETPRATKDDVTLADALDMGGATSTISSRLETWRNKLQNKVKNPDAAMQKLERQLKAIKDEDPTARRLKVIDVMEQFARANDLETPESRIFGSLRFRVRPKTKTDPEGFEQPRQPQKSGGKRPTIAGERDWRGLGKSGRFPETPRRFPVE